MTSEVEIGGTRFRIGKLGPTRQFNIIRRLAPVVTALGNIPELGGGAGGGDDIGLDTLVKSAGPILEALARMTDDDANYVLLNSLRAVERQQGQLWARLVQSGRGDEPLLMFEDLAMPTMLQLVWHVLRENLAGFFPIADAAPNSSVARFPQVSRS